MSEQEAQQFGAQSDGEQTTDHVEMDDATQKRFNRVYANMKEYERKHADLQTALQTSAAEQKKLIDRLEAREKREAEKESRDEIAKLKAAEKTAMEEGNYDEASNVREKITELKIEAKAPKEEAKEEPPAIDLETRNHISQWAAEKSESGTPIRPWADPSHESHKAALLICKGVFEEMQGQPIDAVLAEADRQTKHLTRSVPKQTEASVLSGGDVRPKPAKTKLTSDQKAIAHAMYGNLSAAEAEKRYASAMEKYA